MRILLDEGVPNIIQKCLGNLSISTVEQMWWRGVKNGALLDLMTGKGFQVIVTTDKSLPSQQNLKRRQVSAILLPTNEIPAVITLLSEIEHTVASISLGESKELGMPSQ